MTSTQDPQFVVLVGDVHGNLNWMLNYVLPKADELLSSAGETRKIIIQLGDFGFSIPSGEVALLGLDPLSVLDAALAEAGMELWWIDGNHEDWPGIRRLLAEHKFESGSRSVTDSIPVPGYQCVRYLPRGTRWTWAGRKWLAVGGAVSVDRRLLTEEVNWFPDEEITHPQAMEIIATGPADVLLSHDVPDCWIPELPEPARAWIPELPRAHAHSRRLERIARATGVTRVFHGHYHIGQETVHVPVADDGPEVRVSAILHDGFWENIRLVDVRKP